MFNICITQVKNAVYLYEVLFKRKKYLKYKIGFSTKKHIVENFLCTCDYTCPQVMHILWINNNCEKLVQGENTTIISKKDSDSNVFRKVIHKINTLWNKLVHSTTYCVKNKKKFVDRKKW